MTRKLKKLMSGLMLASMVITMIPSIAMAEDSTQENTKDTIILYTNDVHCAIDGYAKLAVYSAQLEEEGYEVLLIDGGDHIQGEVIGSMTKGSAIVDLMNTVGYDYAVPGNHEFDYKMARFLEIADEEAEYQYLSANFVDLTTDTTVFDAYDIVDLGTEQVAIVGICTPETYTKSTPSYFQDENGNDIYGFSEDDFYNVIQNAIDDAIEEGADRVVVVGHLGIEGTTEGWKSTDVIANTTGIDVFLDAHSHEVIEEATYTNKDGEAVLLSSTGTKFANIGQLTLSEDGVTEDTMLIDPDHVVVNEESSENVQAVYQEVQDKVDGYNAQVEELNEAVLGTAEVELTEYDPADGSWVMRTKETNLGDFVADAYRAVSGADIALVNSGGIRASIPAGDVSRKSLMDVNPWNNPMCVIEATGQQILDALEHGARLYPTNCGGFLQVSGLTYEVHAYIESPVILDEKGSFQGIDETMERRVKNVTVGGEAIDPQKTYTVTGSLYMLKEGGDGYTMFADCEIIKKEVLPVDSEMLIQYFTENLGGKITAAQYGNALGEGRITFVTEEQNAPETGDNTTSGDSEDGKIETGSDTTKSPQTGDNQMIFVYCMLLGMSMVVIAADKKRSR